MTLVVVIYSTRGPVHYQVPAARDRPLKFALGRAWRRFGGVGPAPWKLTTLRVGADGQVGLEVDRERTPDEQAIMPGDWIALLPPKLPEPRPIASGGPGGANEPPAPERPYD